MHSGKDNTERTREFGLRMAVGTRAKDILRQFLIEAILLRLAGGIAGSVFGRGISIAVKVFLHWPTMPSAPAIIAAVAVSVSVGLRRPGLWLLSRMESVAP